MTLPANIRVNVPAPFPARVTGAGVIDVSKSNGIWTIEADYVDLLPLPGASDLSQDLIAVYDTGAGVFWKLSVADLANTLAINPYRIVINAGAVAALSSDGDILINKTVPATTSVTLPLASTAIRPISVVDFAGNAFSFPITILPTGSETISGQASASITQDSGAMTFYPVSGVGWYIK